MFEFLASEYGFGPAYVLDNLTVAQVLLFVEKAISRMQKMYGGDKTIDTSKGIDLTGKNKGFLTDFGIGMK